MRYPLRLLVLLLALTSPLALNAAQENSGIEMKIKTMMLDPHSQTPIVLLESVTDKKLLPIWIDIPEAKSIALELEKVEIPRPLTHDLIRNILQGLGATLYRVTITDLRNNTYFAALTLRFKGQEFQIDSRPSDAIAVALRMKAPIYASPQVLAKSQQVPTPDNRGEQLKRKLGIQAQDLNAELAGLLDIQVQRGILVADVTSGSPATSAGIQRGDIITKANDKTIQGTSDLENLLLNSKKPQQIKLEVIRKGKPTTVVIDLPS
ncbi:MAG TPA: bifunctional nuclease domain-containing protein [Candidatus Binatia bacterium]|nr:bifunctional nuclease domain-containing protein [Candidatus Binatia bacterium]